MCDIEKDLIGHHCYVLVGRGSDHSTKEHHSYIV